MPSLDVLKGAPSILFIGDKQVGKRTLIDRLPGISLPSSRTCAALHIDTKYYTAVARAQLAGGSSPLPAEAISREAVVLVFDSSRETSFHFVKAWVESVGPDEAEIKLCIASKADLVDSRVSHRPPWLAAASEWCNREQFEYIEVAPLDSELDAELELDGERQGVTRVLSALQAHMWPGLVMKGRAEAAPEDHTNLDAGSVSRVITQLTGAPGQIRHGAHVDANSTASLDAVNDNREQPTGSPRFDHVDDGIAAGSIQAASEEALEREMDHFEGLLSEVAGARYKLQGLPDEERRSAAEALTLRLMSQFGLPGEETSDSD